MKTNPTDIFIALFLWLAAISQPVIQHLVPQGISKNVYQYLMFPISLMLLSRSGKFWVRKEIIILSTLISGLATVAIIRNSDTFSQKEINEKENRYIYLSLINISTFAVIFFVMGGLMQLYNPANFNA